MNKPPVIYDPDWMCNVGCPPPEPAPCPAPEPCIVNSSCINVRTQLEPEYIGFDKFVGNIKFEAKGVTAAEAADYARNAAIEFARKAPVLRRRYLIHAQETVTDYFIPVHESEEMWTVEQIKVDGTCLYREESNVNACLHECANGSGRFEFQFPDMVTINDHDNHCPASLIEVFAVVRPKEDACEIDSVIYDQFAQAVKDGALRDLHWMPDREWTSREQGNRKARRFEEHVALAKDNIRRNEQGRHTSVLKGWHV